MEEISNKVWECYMASLDASKCDKEELIKDKTYSKMRSRLKNLENFKTDQTVKNKKACLGENNKGLPSELLIMLVCKRKKD